MELTLNRNKTQLMLVKKKNHANIPTTLSGISLTQTLVHLGVQFDEKLDWRSHVERIAKKAAQRIYPLKQMKRLNIPKKQLIQVYNSYILSLLEYNGPLFVGINKTNASILERIRKRCHRIICSTDCKLNCLPTLSERREKRALNLFHATLNQSHILNHRGRNTFL